MGSSVGDNESLQEENDDVVLLDEDLQIGDEEMESDEFEEVEPPRDDSVQTLTDHLESVFIVAYDPTCRFLATGGMDHQSFVYDASTYEKLFHFTGHDDSVTCLAFNYSGNILATGDMAGMVQVWCKTESSWAKISQYNTSDDLTWLAWFAPTNNAECQAGALMGGDASGMITIWPVFIKNQGDTLVNKATKTPKFLHGFGFSAVSHYCLPNKNKPRLAVLYEDHYLRIWDLVQDTVIKTYELSLNPSIQPSRSTTEEDEMAMEEECSPKMVSLAAAPENKPYSGLLVAASSDGYLVFIPCSENVIDTSLDSPKVSFTHLSNHRVKDETHIETMDFSAVYPYLGYATISGLIGLYDVANMRLRQEWRCFLDAEVAPEGWDPSKSVGITHLKWSRKSPVFFTATLANCVMLWSGLMLSELHGDNPKPLAVYWGHRDNIYDLYLKPSLDDKEEIESNFATCSDDCSVKIFKTHSNPQVQASLDSLKHGSNIVQM